jgi:hypothetical protein
MVAQLGAKYPRLHPLANAAEQLTTYIKQLEIIFDEDIRGSLLL